MLRGEAVMVWMQALRLSQLLASGDAEAVGSRHT